MIDGSFIQTSVRIDPDNSEAPSGMSHKPALMSPTFRPAETDLFGLQKH